MVHRANVLAVFIGTLTAVSGCSSRGVSPEAPAEKREEILSEQAPSDPVEMTPEPVPEEDTRPERLPPEVLIKIVGEESPQIKKFCWDPMLRKAEALPEEKLRVIISVTISPEGDVTNPRHSGDPKGFPGLAACISREVLAWKFPAARATTHVNIPFAFTLKAPPDTPPNQH